MPLIDVFNPSVSKQVVAKVVVVTGNVEVDVVVDVGLRHAPS